MTFPVPFVVGVSRSGTTLLRLMLDAHPQLSIPPETHFLPELIECQPSTVDGFLTFLTATQTWQDFHLDADVLRSRLNAMAEFRLGEAVEAFYALYTECQGKKRWGDKSPPYVLFIAAIQHLLPRVRFIHIIRDVRDVALSLSDKWFGPGADVERAAVFWRDRINAARQQVIGLPENAYLEVRYEDLICNPESVLRRICAVIDLEYDSGMLAYHDQAFNRLGELGDWRNKSGEIVVPRERWFDIHRHTQKPPDRAQIGKWRNHYTAAQLARFREVAGSLMDELGYHD
jgi:hypothetical protein